MPIVSNFCTTPQPVRGVLKHPKLHATCRYTTGNGQQILMSHLSLHVHVCKMHYPHDMLDLRSLYLYYSRHPFNQFIHCVYTGTKVTYSRKEILQWNSSPFPMPEFTESVYLLGIVKPPFHMVSVPPCPQPLHAVFQCFI